MMNKVIPAFLLFFYSLSASAAEMRWFELVSENAQVANHFYSSLFGWEIKQRTNHHYVAILNGQEIAGINQIKNDDKNVQESQWFPAFQVIDLKATLKNAKQAGAEVLREITHARDFGHYAAIRDPQGAVLMLSNAPVKKVGQSAGNWIWSELWTVSPEKSAYFYEDLSGLIAMREEGKGKKAYNVFMKDGESIAGFMPVESSEFQTRWGGYIAVDNLEQTIKKAKQLGGKVFDVNLDQHGAGKVAVLADPLGAVFFIYELKKKMKGDK